MAKDLTSSPVDRQNILNNPYALAEIEKAAGLQGIPFEGKTVVFKEQVAAFFEVTTRTIENYLEQHADELIRNGYEVLKGKLPENIERSNQGAGCSRNRFREHRQDPPIGGLRLPGVPHSAFAYPVTQEQTP